jgi:hypothetical protein
LRNGKGEPEDHQVFGRKDPVREVLREFGPVKGRQENPKAHDHEPERGPEPTEKRPREPREPVEEPLGVQNVEAHEKGAPKVLEPLGLAPFFKAFDQLRSIGHHVRLECVHGVKLAQEADHLLLGGRLFSQPGPCYVPDLLHAPLAVHEADQEVRRRRESLEPARGVVLEHVPQFSPVVVPVDFHMAPQPGL